MKNAKFYNILNTIKGRPFCFKFLSRPDVHEMYFSALILSRTRETVVKDVSFTVKSIFIKEIFSYYD